MEYCRLGRTNLNISRLCLGTFNFEWLIDKKKALELLDISYDYGINLIDTADIYGSKGTGVGAVEEVIGDWFQNNQSKRNQVILSTKVFGPMGNGINVKS